MGIIVVVMLRVEQYRFNWTTTKTEDDDYEEEGKGRISEDSMGGVLSTKTRFSRGHVPKCVVTWSGRSVCMLQLAEGAEAYKPGHSPQHIEAL